MAQPTLTSQRLILRPFRVQDAAAVQVLVGDRDIAANTLNIPHPYPEGQAERWIATHEGRFERLEGATFAIVPRDSEKLIGAIGLEINQQHNRAELGYWVGKPYWNRGFATEAVQAVLGYAFNALEMGRVYASHFRRNPASGRVMQKVGMRHEGRLRRHVRKWGSYLDLEIYGILREEYPAEL
jgi:ribosomal-protein-alanine N-acetyltransferase